ncbi:MAG: DUF669 domain-containing protein [Oscillospiraceae bacterium]|jgi:hypothetical protein|nr:DUF669 domain-containing protein [Oscillospiraceae bacterium]
MADYTEDRALDWDADLDVDAKEFPILPDGDYDFTVEKFDRERHEGSAKMPVCPKAVLSLRILAPDGETVTVRHNLFLTERLKWKVSEFFTAIGQKRAGETVTMNWNAVPGSTGRCKIGAREYDGKTYNEVKKFYPAKDGAGDDKCAAPSPAAGGWGGKGF